MLKKNQSAKVTYCMIPFMKCFWSDEILEHRWVVARGEGWEGSGCGYQRARGTLWLRSCPVSWLLLRVHKPTCVIKLLNTHINEYNWGGLKKIGGLIAWARLSWLWFYTIVLQDVITEENWVKGTQDLSVLFLTSACESAIISKSNI